MDKNLIELINIHVNYGKKSAVNNISLKFNKGETVLIAGRNGAGNQLY